MGDSKGHHALFQGFLPPPRPRTQLKRHAFCISLACPLSQTALLLVYVLYCSPNYNYINGGGGGNLSSTLELRHKQENA